MGTDSVLGTSNAVGSGMGFNLLPDHVREVSPPTLAIRPLNRESAPRLGPLVAYRKGDEPPVLRVFLGLLQDWIADRHLCGPAA